MIRMDGWVSETERESTNSKDKTESPTSRIAESSLSRSRVGWDLTVDKDTPELWVGVGLSGLPRMTSVWRCMWGGAGELSDMRAL